MACNHIISGTVGDHVRVFDDHADMKITTTWVDIFAAFEFLWSPVVARMADGTYAFSVAHNLNRWDQFEALSFGALPSEL